MCFLTVLAMFVYIQCSEFTTVTAASQPFSVSKTVATKVVISVEDGLEPDSCEDILEELEESVSSATRHVQRLTDITFKNFVIVLPSSWNGTACLSNRTFVANQNEALRKPDIRLEGSGLLKTAWAEQFSGCGNPGKVVHLPVEFLNSANQDKGLVIAKEWIKYRYGVFEETGFDGDLQYPGIETDLFSVVNSSLGIDEEDFLRTEDDRNETRVSLDDGLKGFLQRNSANYNRYSLTKQNIICHEKSAWETIQSHPDFNPKNIQTIMSSQDESSPFFMEEDERRRKRQASDNFETEATANQSLEEVEEKSEIVSGPKFEYLIRRKTKLVFVLERTKRMEAEIRWTLIRRAMSRVILSLTEGTEIAIVSYGPGATISLPLTAVTSLNREGLIGRIPRKASQEEEFCLDCAVSAAKKVLRDTQSSGRIILITGSDENRIADEIDPETSVVIFPAAAASSTLLRFSYAHSVLESEKSHSVTQQRLTQALTDAVREVGGVDSYQVFERTHWRKDASTITGKFLIPENLGTNTLVAVHAADEGDVEAFEIRSPSGEVGEFPRFGDGVVYFKTSDLAEAGEWSYKLKLIGERSTTAAVVEVVSEPRDTDSDQLEAFVWTSSSDGPINASVTSLVIYAKVMLGRKAIWNASVIAVVSRPGMSGVEVELKDSGFGDPDITRGDGIYSAYFTHFTPTPGYYSVRLVVSNKDLTALVAAPSEMFEMTCCGSILPYQGLTRLEDFELTGITTTFYVSHGIEQNKDVYPPSRVMDFRVSAVLNDSSEVELTWSAPGGSFDHDRESNTWSVFHPMHSGFLASRLEHIFLFSAKYLPRANRTNHDEEIRSYHAYYTPKRASRYEIRCYTDRESLSDANFETKGILVHASSTPEPAGFGTEQRCRAQVPWPNEIFYYALVAVDVSSNRARVSNIVPVFIYEAPLPPSTTTQTSVVESDNSEEVWLVSSSNASYAKELHHLELYEGIKNTELYALIGGVAGGVLLLLSLFFIAILCRKRGKNETDKDMEKTKEATPKLEHESERPIYQIYVNNAYIQEENGELKIMTPDGKTVQRSVSPSWYATMPRNKRPVPEEPTQNYISSLPRSKNVNRQNKVLTNGSIMTAQATTIIGIVGDGTSISSKPSVASDDTGIESCEERNSETVNEGLSYGYDRGIKLDPTRLAVTHDLSYSSDSVRNLSPLDLASNQLGIPSAYEMTHSLPNPRKCLQNSFLSFRETRLDSVPYAQSSPLNVRSSMHVPKKKRHISFV